MTNYEWLLSVHDAQRQGRNASALSSPALDKVADAVFYTRHPELDYRSDTTLTNAAGVGAAENPAGRKFLASLLLMLTRNILLFQR